MIYIDVILPLPLEGLFTYSVHIQDAHKAVVGKRVVVPLGRSKTYTGIIERVHNTKPSFDTRDAIDFPDALPVVLEKQLDLWKWIAHYYMTPLGDVYKAAVPAGLKAEEGYRPRTETYVQLHPSYQSKEGLSRAISLVKRANKQLQMLECYLSISHWNDALQGDNTQEISEITRVELMNVSNGNATALQGLTGKCILTTYEQEITRLNTSNNEQTIRTKVLSAPQQDAYNSILMQWMKRDIVLLHGVTSSGKTEVYIHLIQNALEKHQQVLYILPEIALTVQITQRLQRIFGNQLGIYHSKYNDAERVEIWKKQLSDNPYKVILGVRSSVFLPFQNLGLIIIDEEHETSFKQQDPAPRYHARSVAVMLAKMYNAKTLLGTATPSMESYNNACQGKYGLVKLTTRFKDIALPKIEIIDVKDLRRRKIMKGIFSQPLVDAVQQAIDEGKQAILFQNRRGFAPMLECKECGWVPKCQNCDVSLTIHKNMNHLSCHYCGFTYLIPSSCPKCGCTELRSKGYGTEKIEELVSQTFQGARISRMDLDTTRTKNAYERIINDFSQGRTNILIGTQMVTKGLDFDKVKVVGIIDADSILNYPDFRSYEYAFMMMGQVAGRAGRKGEQGRVILQTKNADIPIISQIANNDFKAFYNDTLEERMMFKYPPFYRLIYIYIKHKHEKVAEGAANVLAGRLRSWFGERLLGPDRPSIARVKDLHIRKLMLKLELGLNGNDVREYLRMAQAELLNNKPYAAIQIYYDIDPM